MGVNFQYQKFYFNENTKQAIGVIAKADTVTWGKCMVVEVATPGKLGIIYPMKLDQDTTGWHEIPETEFKRLQIEYGSNAVIQTAATADRPRDSIASWIFSKLRRSPKKFVPRVINGN